MTTQPRILRRAALAAGGVVAAGVALVVTLVSAVGHSAGATTPDTSTSTSGTSDDSTSGSTNSGTGTGLSSDDDQSQAPVGGSNGS